MDQIKSVDEQINRLDQKQRKERMRSSVSIPPPRIAQTFEGFKSYHDLEKYGFYKSSPYRHGFESDFSRPKHEILNDEFYKFAEDSFEVMKDNGANLTTLSQFCLMLKDIGRSNLKRNDAVTITAIPVDTSSRKESTFKVDPALTENVKQTSKHWFSTGQSVTGNPIQSSQSWFGVDTSPKSEVRVNSSGGFRQSSRK